MQEPTRRIFSLAKESSIYGVGAIINKFLMFLVTVSLWSVWFGETTNGELALFYLIDPAEQIVAILLILGLNQSLLKQIKEQTSTVELSRSLSTVFWFNTGIILVAILLLSLVANEIIVQYLPNNAVVALCYSLALGSLLLRNYQFIAVSYLRATNRVITLESMNVLGTFLFLAYNLIGFWLIKGGIEQIFIARLLIFLPVVLVGFYYIKPFLKFTFDPQILVTQLKFGVPFVLAGMAYPILNYFDQQMLYKWVSATTTEIYGMSYKFGLIPQMILVTPFLKAWQPAIYEPGREEVQFAVYKRVLLYYTLAGCVLWLGLAVFSQEWLILFSTPKFYAGYTTIPYVAASQFFYGLGWITIAGLALRSNTLFIGVWTSFGAGINILLNYFWIPKFGMLGAAYATLVAFVVIFLGFALYSQRKLHIQWNYARFGMMLLISLLSYGILSYLQIDTMWMRFLLKGLLLIPVFVLLLYLAGLKPAKLKEVFAFIKNPTA